MSLCTSQGHVLYYFSINSPSKEAQWSLAIEWAQWPFFLIYFINFGAQIVTFGTVHLFIYLFIYHITSIPSLQGLNAQIRSGS